MLLNEMNKKNKIISRYNKEVLLYLEVFQSGVIQFAKEFKIKNYFAKKITFGSHEKNDIFIPFSKIPNSIDIFKIGGETVEALLDQRLEGFLNNGQSFGDIKDFIAPKGSLGYLSEINSPLSVPLKLGSRGRFKINGFEIAFKIEEVKPERILPKKLGVDSGLFHFPDFDSRYEKFSPLFGIVFSLVIFIPCLFWLFNSPQKIRFGLEYLPEKIALQIIHPDHIRLLPFTMENQFENRRVTEQAVTLISELQRRWRAAETHKEFTSQIALLNKIPVQYENNNYEELAKVNLQKKYDELEQYRTSGQSPRYYSFLKPYPGFTTIVSGKSLGSNKISIKKRLAQIKKFDSAVKNYLKIDHEFMKDYLAPFEIKKAGIVDPPLTNRLLGPQPDISYQLEYLRYLEAEYLASKAEKSDFRKFLNAFI
ncbi:MAG: hypothetical protein K2X39_07405, partial [Silvanigrellaceae bacterium]|nr:hypothetical protein [Silvanigrellaceae bacterium]